MANARRRRSPVVWLVVAAVLLVAGAWLMRGAEPPERTRVDPVSMPTRMTRQDREKNEARRTWLQPDVFDAGVAQEPPRPRDPVLAVMPGEVKRGAVVAEFNAIMNSELGPKLTECLFGADDGSRFLSELRDAGLDPVNGVDRVAMIDDAMVMTGDFRNTKWKELSGADHVKDYGSRAQILESDLTDGGIERFGVWNGQMVVFSRSEDELKRVLDRLEGKGVAENHVLNDSMAYGEVYGVVAAEPMARIIQASDPKLAELVRQSAKSAQLHMDVGHDVGMVADIAPNDPSTSDELRRTLGAALSLARMKATAEGQKDVADLLDLAHVRAADGTGGFRLEAGMPHDFMKKALDECIAEQRAGGLGRARDAGP